MLCIVWIWVCVHHSKYFHSFHLFLTIIISFFVIQHSLIFTCHIYVYMVRIIQQALFTHYLLSLSNAPLHFFIIKLPSWFNISHSFLLSTQCFIATFHHVSIFLLSSSSTTENCSPPQNHSKWCAFLPSHPHDPASSTHKSWHTITVLVYILIISYKNKDNIESLLTFSHTLNFSKQEMSVLYYTEIIINLKINHLIFSNLILP